jgi:hypothetical protein
VERPTLFKDKTVTGIKKIQDLKRPSKSKYKKSFGNTNFTLVVFAYGPLLDEV